MATATRERILDAALRAFATRGVDGTPITDLEEAAGLAPGSGGFYRYFRTKDEALAAVVRREIDRVEAAAGEAPAGAPADLPSGDDATALVAADLRGGLDMLRSLGPLIAILARERGRVPGLGAEVAERLVGGGLARDGRRLGALAGDEGPDDPATLGAVVVSALVGYALATDYFGAPPGDVDRERFVEALAGLLVPRGHPLPDKEHSL